MLGTDSNIVALLDVNVVQQRLSTVTFQLCFPYVPHDSTRVDACFSMPVCVRSYLMALVFE